MAWDQQRGDEALALLDKAEAGIGEGSSPFLARLLALRIEILQAQGQSELACAAWLRFTGLPNLEVQPETAAVQAIARDLGCAQQPTDQALLPIRLAEARGEVRWLTARRRPRPGDLFPAEAVLVVDPDAAVALVTADDRLYSLTGPGQWQRGDLAALPSTRMPGLFDAADLSWDEHSLRRKGTLRIKSRDLSGANAFLAPRGLVDPDRLELWFCETEPARAYKLFLEIEGRKLRAKIGDIERHAQPWGERELSLCRIPWPESWPRPTGTAKVALERTRQSGNAVEIKAEFHLGNLPVEAGTTDLTRTLAAHQLAEAEAWSAAIRLRLDLATRGATDQLALARLLIDADLPALAEPWLTPLTLDDDPLLRAHAWQALVRVHEATANTEAADMARFRAQRLMEELAM